MHAARAPLNSKIAPAHWQATATVHLWLRPPPAPPRAFISSACCGICSRPAPAAVLLSQLPGLLQQLVMRRIEASLGSRCASRGGGVAPVCLSRDHRSGAAQVANQQHAIDLQPPACLRSKIRLRRPSQEIRSQKSNEVHHLPRLCQGYRSRCRGAPQRLRGRYEAALFEVCKHYNSKNFAVSSTTVHIMMRTPHPGRSAKLSIIELSQY